MKIKVSVTCLVVSLLVSGCSSVGIMPPVDVPSASFSHSDESGTWRPYRSGPLQAASLGVNRSQGAWATEPETTVIRKPLPDVLSPTLESSASQDGDAPVVRTRRGNTHWTPYKEHSERVRAKHSESAFGKGVDSPWAKEYVPDSYHTEFGIFARRAAANGQAKMVMPTGEVYSASLVRRNGHCVSLEVGVTGDGDLPLLARGLVEVCR